MGIIENEGRYIRSKSLRDSAVKRKHPLNFMDRSVASHHIISCEATRRLSSYRRKQITYKGYDVNHPWNLVILPMKDRIACHFKMPLHKSGHKDEGIITHYERSLGVSLAGLQSELVDEASQESSQDKRKILADDVSVIDVLSGYHKIVGVKLARALKGLTCKTSKEGFSSALDDLSIEILGEISRDKLLLIRRGKDFAKNKAGCEICQTPGSNTKRVHFGPLDKAPSLAKVRVFCYAGRRLKTVKEQK
ncbi:AHH domain-containing protein [Vibrio sp. VPAP30]|uniref:AHH domain-containing protein n=1 Tax=Vibrio sp. VPAP30 TaxID=1647102 RepID=UPI0006769B37|nr:AHH domain-containing protein [Vibrio sp. VPAP30]